MKIAQHILFVLFLISIVAFQHDGCFMPLEPVSPPVEQPAGLSVSPNNGLFTPVGLDVNQQALLTIQQSLSTEEGTEYFSQLDALNSLLERLGEKEPPGRPLPAAPPRMPLKGKLSSQRALELSRLAPVTIVGSIDQTVDGVTFTGKSSINEENNLITAQLQGVSADGTNISINQKYSNNPDDFTYYIEVSGTLIKDGLKMSYDIFTDYDSGGNGNSNFDFKVLNDADKTAYDMQLVLSDNGHVLRSAEAVTRADGFWTVAKFEGILDANTQRIVLGDFDFEASNDYSGSFALNADGAASGVVKNASAQMIANLSVNPLGDVTIIYVDGSGQNIIKL